MRIALVGSVIALGGIEQHMLNLALGLQRAGHEARIFGLVNAGGFEFLQEWSDPDHVLETEFAGANGIGLVEAIEAYAPDIVNVELPMAPEELVGCGRPMVGTLHGPFSVMPFGGLREIVAVDDRVLDHARGINGKPARLVRHGIDLKRFEFRDDAKEREGIAYWGRACETKLAPVRAVQEVERVDLWGDPIFDKAAGRPLENVRAEDVCYQYQVVMGTGLCALEAMACGALLLMPEPNEASLDKFSRANFDAATVYPPGTESQARVDLAGIKTLADGGMSERARLCRDWVEANHSVEMMAEGFLEVYEEAI